MKKIKIGIIGCGAIGSALAKAIVKDFGHFADLVCVCDSHQEKVKNLVRKITRPVAASSLNEVIHRADFIIEAASPAVAREAVKKALSKHKQIFVLSVGGLLFLKNLVGLTGKSKGRVWIPSGAIAGIDGILAASEAGIRSVRLKITKPPAGLIDAPYFKKRRFPKLSGHQKICVFRGNALAAVKAFPKNANVAALLSLAGIGAKRTQVEIWTAAGSRINQHQIEVIARSGRLNYEIQNVPSQINPRTSALAIFSAVATLRKIFQTLRFGT